MPAEPLDPQPWVAPLLAQLSEMHAALQVVTPQALSARGGWDRTLFDQVLAHVQAVTPDFQAALTAYLVAPLAHPAPIVDALLEVDRLSAAYTYWTRLFPPGKQSEAMFVLSLLHDLAEKVDRAGNLLHHGYA